MLENVYALTYNNSASRSPYERLLREIGEAGYDYRAQVLHGADYGVPQALLADVPPGDNYLYYTAERGNPAPKFTWRSRYWSLLLKLSPERPSPTIQAQPGPNVGPFHWENRLLRVSETKRLFTFPDDFTLVDCSSDGIRAAAVGATYSQRRMTRQPASLSRASVSWVALHVTPDLACPVSRVRARLAVVLRAAVPKAAIDEYGNLEAWKNNVSAAPQVRKWSCTDAKSVTKTV